uniref:Uncharacterized protein n=1 Tax=viral metagenome TaxID=1070528 RepID=A0A6C0BMW9_9ZZZZ
MSSTTYIHIIFSNDRLSSHTMYPCHSSIITSTQRVWIAHIPLEMNPESTHQLAQFIDIHCIPDGLIGTHIGSRSGYDLSCVVRSNTPAHIVDHIRNTYCLSGDSLGRRLILNLTSLGVDVFHVFRHSSNDVLRDIGNNPHASSLQHPFRVPRWRVQAGVVVERIR